MVSALARRLDLALLYFSDQARWRWDVPRFVWSPALSLGFGRPVGGGAGPCARSEPPCVRQENNNSWFFQFRDCAQVPSQLKLAVPLGRPSPLAQRRASTAGVSEGGSCGGCCRTAAEERSLGVAGRPASRLAGCCEAGSDLSRCTCSL